MACASAGQQLVAVLMEVATQVEIQNPVADSQVVDVNLEAELYQGAGVLLEAELYPAEDVFLEVEVYPVVDVHLEVVESLVAEVYPEVGELLAVESILEVDTKQAVDNREGNSQDPSTMGHNNVYCNTPNHWRDHR